MKEKRLISFAPGALRWLKSQAVHLDISVSEFLRRLVDAERQRQARRRS